MNVQLALLVLASYLLGSVPAAYLVARWLKGIDLRRYGTGNVGASNLLAATSKRAVVPVIIFDLVKGVALVWAAWLLEFTLAQQALVGVAAIAGHNWSVFLRFSSGRGALTTAGVAFFLPWLNGYLGVAPGIAVLTVLVGVLITHSTASGVTVGITCLPIASLALHEPEPVTLTYFAMFLIIIVRRLTAPQVVRLESLSRRRLLVNRLLFDRDVRDKKAWMELLRSHVGQAARSPNRETREEKG